MDREEAIEILENGEWWDELAEWYMIVHPEHDKLHEAVDMAVAALREQEERENPNPLTLDEMWNMNGEPVWVETGGFNAWGIVGIDDDGIYVNSKSLEGYNIQWRVNTVRAIRCYRYKPKE